MIEKSNYQKSSKSISLTQSPIKSAFNTDDNPHNLILKSALQNQQIQLKLKEQQQLQVQEELRKTMARQHNIMKYKRMISILFAVFIITEICILSQKKWYNPNDLPECSKQMKWTIGSILGKFLFIATVLIEWRKQRKQNSNQEIHQIQNKKLTCFQIFIKFLYIGCIIGQFIYITNDCGALQIALIIFITIITFICFIIVIIYALKKFA